MDSFPVNAGRMFGVSSHLLTHPSASSRVPVWLPLFLNFMKR
jgi:hypothetical protein